MNPCRNADTARSIKWLSDKEKDVYYWLNFVRVNPREFCDTYIIPFLDDTGSEQDPYLLSLIDYLYAMKPLNALVPDKKLFEAAQCRALTLGKFQNDKNVKGKECYSPLYIESRDYGNYTARAHVIRLLLSKDKPNLQSRYNCLDFFSNIGISIAPHEKRELILVVNFYRDESK